MNPLNTGLVLLAFASLLTLLGLLARIKRRQLVQFDRCQKAFYKHAGTLIESPRTPEEIVRFLEFGARALGRRWALLLFIAFTPFARHSASREGKSRLSEEAQALPPVMKESFYTALDSLFGAMCWQSLFLSWVFRWITRPVRKPKVDHANKGATELALVERVCARAA